ncbi:Cytochrome P450 [Corchorus capsularis]|uniref:Cytochrome P450 n=1 Tax=Corchorus capsularis TaxID=210143 RepID=A0A1R3K9M1_COCAP|nr:Cytochrome P450 [Corchorus capsularis]
MGILTFFIILLITLFFFVTLLKSLHNHLILTKKSKQQLPPGPPKIPFFGNLLWLHKSLSQMKAIVPSLRAKYGPIFTLHVGSKPIIFIASNSLAHQALIVKGAVFADRPLAVPTDKFLTSNQHNIGWAFYGPTWLLLRRNLTSNILQPSRIKSYACARKWVLDILINRLTSHSFSNDQIDAIQHFQHALFSLLAFMCFGDKLEEKQIQEIKDVQRRLQLSFDKFQILNLFPNLGRIVFYKRWEKLRQLRRDQENAMVPFIRARKYKKESANYSNEPFVPYVDTLLDLQLPEEKRKLKETEIVTLCSEFFTAGTDTTSTALQWVLGYLVKYPKIQEKLFMEIKGVIGDGKKEINEDDLPKIPYTKAVILEALRRNPPTHFLIPHAVTKDVKLNGYLVPKNSIVTFMVAEIGRDPKVWGNPMEFRPERFLKGREEGEEAFDITGIREIKMIPFGVGRRMCPGYGLALLHLEYFVANMVLNFKWAAGNVDQKVDLSEKHEFTTVMKNPLKVHITPRMY